MTTRIPRYAVCAMAVLMSLTLAGTLQAAPAGFTAPITPVNAQGMPPGFDWRAGSLVLADFNGDGKIDAAVPGSFMAGVCIVSSGGAQTWLGTGPWPVALAVGDFNGDGFPDLAVAERDGGGISILTNSGTGTFARTAFYATGPANAAVGPIAVLAVDLDKDGRIDLVVANRFAETVVVLHNTGPGFVLTQTVPVSGEPNALVAADLDNDGWLDIAVACASDDTVKVLKNTNGILALAGTFPGGPYPVAVAAADLNNDGNMDLAVADREAPQVTVLLSDGAGGFTARDVPLASADAPFDPPTDVQLIDTNADSKIDIRCAGKTLLNDGAANFTVSDSQPWAWVIYARGVLPADPYTYLGVGYRTATSGTYGTETVAVTFQAPASVATRSGDVNGDGSVDVVDLLTLIDSFGKSTGEVGFVAACDFNGDGSVDVVDLLTLVENFGV